MKDFLRQTLSVHLEVLGKFVRIFRSVRLSLQAEPLFLSQRWIPSGLLGSTGITPLHRYYEPIRLLTRHRGMRGLSVPEVVCRHAPSPLTPESPTVASTRFFTVGA